MTDAEGRAARLAELATERAQTAHGEQWARRAIFGSMVMLLGHDEHDFTQCPHPDCRLVREGSNQLTAHTEEIAQLRDAVTAAVEQRVGYQQEADRLTADLALRTRERDEARQRVAQLCRELDPDVPEIKLSATEMVELQADFDRFKVARDGRLRAVGDLAALQQAIGQLVAQQRADAVKFEAKAREPNLAEPEKFGAKYLNEGIAMGRRQSASELAALVAPRVPQEKP